MRQFDATRLPRQGEWLRKRPRSERPGLAPVAGVPDVAAALGTPLSGDPDGPATRWTAVGTGDPDVAVTVPAMVAVNPNKTGLRRHAALFNNGSRWTYANRNLRLGSHRNHSHSQGQCEQYCQYNFLHDDSIPPGS